jgi:Predicted transcriptional regulator
MNLHFELSKKPTFSREDLEKYYNGIEGMRSAIRYLLEDGLVMKIRNNLYTCISGETGSAIANHYQIACALTPTAYISHHTAMEYYGVGDQIFYEVYVSSSTRFREFSFEGYSYKYISSKCDIGIIEAPYSAGVRVTDRERTVIDSIKDIGKIAGIEEVVANISSLSRLNTTKLLEYLKYYQNQFLYQKVGFLLENYQEKLGLSDSFFEICKEKTGKSKRYLAKEAAGGKYNGKWKLIVPSNVFNLKNGE